MAYKYFTKTLLDSGLVDLDSVFPEKQRLAKEQNNVSYGLASVVDYLRTQTNNFKLSDNKFIDIDNAISSIIDEWYKSKDEKNPFRFDEEDIVPDSTYDKGNTPREAAAVRDGRVVSRGAPKAAPSMVPSVKQDAEAKKTIEETVVNPVQGIEEVPAVVEPSPVPAPTPKVVEEMPVPTPVFEAAAPQKMTKEEILSTIEMLKDAAEMGDQEALDFIAAYQMLLEDDDD